VKKSRQTVIFVIVAFLGIFSCLIFSLVIIQRLINMPAFQNGFKQVTNSFGGMIELKQKISSKFACEQVGVSLVNGNALQVTIINSDYFHLSHDDQIHKARDIAEFVRKNYTDIGSISRIAINFVERKQILFFSSSVSVTHLFSIDSSGSNLLEQ
jgi:hypothetical protein